MAGSAHAQQSAARGWLDVNFGTVSMTHDGFENSVSVPVFGETATFGASYAQPLGAHFDFGGGYMFVPRVGIGVSFSGDVSDGTPTLTARIPHPLYFNAFASDTIEGDTDLRRSEGAVNISIVVNAMPFNPKFNIRLFGGPTYYRVTQDAVTDIRYNQQFAIFAPTQNVDITNYTFDEVEGTGWGYHIGLDANVFFSNVVGVGFGIKYGGATVPLENALFGEYDSDAGGFNFFGGLRLRFGR